MVLKKAKGTDKSDFKDVRLNTKTGEIREIVHPNSKDAFRRLQKAQTEREEWDLSNGINFTSWYSQEAQRLFWSDDRFSDTEKVRIMYIATFVGYDGKLMENPKKPLTKKELKKKLDFGTERQFYQLYNKLVDHKLLTEEEDELYWDKKIAFKGKLTKNVQLNDLVRMYDKAVRDLYEQNSLKGLPVVFRLLPYVNRYTNIISKEVDTNNFGDFHPLSIEEIAEVLGVNAKRFKSNVSSLMVGDEFVFATTKIGSGYWDLTINPRLVLLADERNLSTVLMKFNIAKELYKKKLAKKNTKKELN